MEKKPALAVSTSTLGRYTLLEKISSGGMGDVFLAVSPGASGANGLFKFVAIKLVRREIINKTDAKHFFQTEGQIGLHLSHSNLVQMYEAANTGSEFFFVMEYINGLTMDVLIKKATDTGVVIPTNILLYILVEFANALSYIHSYVNTAFDIREGIVHQDISANNVMLDFNGRVKVIDFGISKPQAHVDENYLVMGKLGYMSPEQMNKETVTARSDIYSFGVTMWELVCGRRLFHGPDTEAINKKRASGQIPPLRQFNPEAPAALQDIVSRCLKADPEDRYASMDDVLQELFKVMNQEGMTLHNTFLAAYLDKEFKDEKYKNMQKLNRYSQDIMSSKLKISVAAVKEAHPVRRPLAQTEQPYSPPFTDVVETTSSGAVLQKRFILVHEKSCSMSQIGALSANEIFIDGSVPKAFWGQQCMMVYKGSGKDTSKSLWVYVSTDGKRLQRNQVSAVAAALGAEQTKTVKLIAS